jgi:hypothetical protein
MGFTHTPGAYTYLFPAVTHTHAQYIYKGTYACVNATVGCRTLASPQGLEPCTHPYHGCVIPNWQYYSPLHFKCLPSHNATVQCPAPLLYTLTQAIHDISQYLLVVCPSNQEYWHIIDPIQWLAYLAYHLKHDI